MAGPFTRIARRAEARFSAEPAPGPVAEPAVEPATVAAAEPPTRAAEPATAVLETPAPEPPVEPVTEPASFRSRGRVRRRVRYLRRLREVQLRDLGGLVFELHRAGRERGDLVAGKLEGLTHTHAELHALEDVLGRSDEHVEIREPGIGGTCATCGALHGSADAFCASCGTELRGSA